MSTLRVSNIEAKADPSSPSVNEKVKITNSNGDVMLQLDGATSGITTVGINTTGNAFTVDANQNINFTGVVTATSFSGNLTGNVTGNVTGGITTSQITVGDSFIKSGAVGLGSTTSRPSPVESGTLILNTNNNKLEVYGPEGWTTVKNLVNTGITASGGIIGDYESGGVYYRSHTFTSSGTFDVTELGDYSNTVEYLVVAGGGAGGAYGGGGAGGLRSSDPSMPAPLRGTALTVSTSPGSYTVTIGAGGNAMSPSPVNNGNSGNDTVFGSITSTGGGGGAGDDSPIDGAPGGSGGGGNRSGGAGGTGTPGQGNPGGASPNNHVGGGGGGAGQPGGDTAAPPGPGGLGGDGLSVSITGVSTHYAGGGGGGANVSYYTGGAGGLGGGGTGGSYPPAETGTAGAQGTGGGGGGGGNGLGPNVESGLRHGGSGIVVVKYQIGVTQTSTAKATGGSINFYDGRTIHVFRNTGSFTTPSSFNETVHYVVIGGGGNGGFDLGGGGGAGAWVENSQPISGSNTFTVTVGGGGAGALSATKYPGSNSTINFPTSVTAQGGGAGGSPSSLNGDAGGSGGGARGNGSNTGGTGNGDPFPGTPGNSPANGWGNDGGSSAPSNSAGGGGGAGGVGGSPPSTNGLHGGVGVQLPSAYRDPRTIIGYPGPGSTTGWFAGGGGSSCWPSTSGGGKGGGPGGPYAGAGDGSVNPTTAGTDALVNSGSGGGSGHGSGTTGDSYHGGAGGSGIVIISYPT